MECASEGISVGGTSVESVGVCNHLFPPQKTEAERAWKQQTVDFVHPFGGRGWFHSGVYCISCSGRFPGPPPLPNGVSCVPLDTLFIVDHRGKRGSPVPICHWVFSEQRWIPLFFLSPISTAERTFIDISRTPLASLLRSLTSPGPPATARCFPTMELGVSDYLGSFVAAGFLRRL